MPFDNKPILVFWETTKACPLNCVHCRAEAIGNPLPGELSTSEGKALIDVISSFGKPAPVIVFTGGDPLRRKDLFELLEYAKNKGVASAVAPAVSEDLTPNVLDRIKSSGVVSISLSLDSSYSWKHDAIRRKAGTFDKTMDTIRYAKSINLGIQINTTVMKSNITELPRIFALLKHENVRVWEVFFLINTGRGAEVEDISAAEYESVCNFLYDASQYGIVIRVVEGPFIRRVAKLRASQGAYWSSEDYLIMREELISEFGEPTIKPTISQSGTLDGDGIIFVSHDGTISPGGFTPVALGNIKSKNLVEVYRNDARLVSIRSRGFHGECGSCKFKEKCGGSRARAFASSKDLYGSDIACIRVTEAGPREHTKFHGP